MSRARTAAAVAVLIGAGCFFVTNAEADLPPSSAAQAATEFGPRSDNLVRRTIVRLDDMYRGELQPDLWGTEPDKPREYARHRVAMASAVLWVLSHPSDFIHDDMDAYYRLQKRADALMEDHWSASNYYTTWRYWIGNQSQPGKLWELFDKMYFFSDPGCWDYTHLGTMCDYDFVLVDLAHLIYTYQDGDKALDDPLFNWPAVPGAVPPPIPGRPWTYADFLKNEMIYSVICHRDFSTSGPRTCEYPQDPVPYMFRQLDDAAVFKQNVCGKHGVACTTTAETENHVLGIVTWDYLATNWVMWQGSLVGGRRKYGPMTTLWQRMVPTWLAEAEKMYHRVLRVVGRVMHSGMYETNSRPYGRVSLSALMALANHAEPLMGHYNYWGIFPVPPKDVKRGALNAVEYLQVKYAFQSLRGKRQGPMRRSNDFKKLIDFYKHNSFVTMMSLLSGSREWDDCIEDTKTNNRLDCPMLAWNNAQSRDSELAIMLSASSTGYRILPIIHDSMFERGPFYARMKSRYTKQHYPLMLGYPKYFVTGSDTEAFHTGTNKSSVELYFGDDNILLTAGGSYKSFYSGPKNDFWAKPTMLIPRGDFGHYSETGAQWWLWREDTLKDVIKDVMVSPGKVWDWEESKCNVWLYRNFVYGYRFHDRHGPGGGDRRLALPLPHKQNWTTFVAPGSVAGWKSRARSSVPSPHPITSSWSVPC